MQLFWTALGGLLVGLLGILAVPGHRPRTLLGRWLGPMIGLGGALVGNALAAAVLGKDHRTVTLVVALVIAAIAVSGYAAYLRTRAFA